MGIFGKSRANSASQVSQPVLTFSDAAPREDLKALSSNYSSRPPAGRTGRSFALPSTSRRHQQPQNAIQTFDFTVTAPPESPSGQGKCSNDDGTSADGIGIALGSPSMLPRPQDRPVNGDAYWPSISVERRAISSAETPATTNPDVLTRKPSIWTAFGGFLKGKQSETKRARDGFYQLDTTNRPKEDTVVSLQDTMTSDKRSLKDALNHGDIGSGSLLNINIPAVEMERYSVMFGSVLGEKPSSSNLLARRSKALDQLNVRAKESNLSESPRPQRRGTSPVPSRSSGFSLFPSGRQGEIADKTDKTKNQRGPPSPARSNTYPRTAGLSRNKANNDSNLLVPDLTPALSTGTSFDYCSAESSPTSFQTPLIPIKPHLDAGAKVEPVWEMVTKPPSTLSSDPPSSYNIVSPNLSVNSSPATTPQVGTGTPEGISPKNKALPKPKSPPRKTSLPTHPLAGSSTPEDTDSKTKRLPISTLPRKASLPVHLENRTTKAEPKANVRARAMSVKKTPLQFEAEEQALLPEKPTQPPSTRQRNAKQHQQHQQQKEQQTQPPPARPLLRSQTMPLSLATNDTVQVAETQSPLSRVATESRRRGTREKAANTIMSTTPQTIEISIARSVSVTRRVPKQTLVPLGATPEAFHNENERFGEHQKLLPTLVDVGGGRDKKAGGGGLHQYQKSQDLVIESL